MEVLEDPTHQFTADIDHTGGAFLSVRALVERDAALVSSKQATDDVEQGGLPGPRRAHQGNHLAGLNGEVHALEDVELVAARTEGFL